jgi:hypothetical protein
MPGNRPDFESFDSDPLPAGVTDTVIFRFDVLQRLLNFTDQKFFAGAHPQRQGTFIFHGGLV